MDQTKHPSISAVIIQQSSGWKKMIQILQVHLQNLTQFFNCVRFDSRQEINLWTKTQNFDNIQVHFFPLRV